MIKVYLGPNGFGKTHALEEDRKQLIESGVSANEILFLQSEILLLDEVKDTKDESKTMEYILSEILLSSPGFIYAKSQFESQLSNEIVTNQANMDAVLDEVLQMNGNVRDPNVHFISQNDKLAYKNLVRIDSKELKTKTGSGQRMQLILELVKRSNSKKYIFLDEPEKYSHPTLLNKTASLIHELINRGCDVYMATHSPRLLSMLRIPLSALRIINNPSHAQKTINLSVAASVLAPSVYGKMSGKAQSFFDPVSLESNIHQIYYKDFLEALFAKEIYLCEGLNDKLFLMRVLQAENKYYGDYAIFQTFGKCQMPVFEKIFSDLGIKTKVFFDEDVPSPKHPYRADLNAYLGSLNGYKFVPDLETEIGYKGEKYDTVALLSHLDSFSFAPRKYI